MLRTEVTILCPNCRRPFRTHRELTGTFCPDCFASAFESAPPRPAPSGLSLLAALTCLALTVLVYSLLPGH